MIQAGLQAMIMIQNMSNTPAKWCGRSVYPTSDSDSILSVTGVQAANGKWSNNTYRIKQRIMVLPTVHPPAG